MNYDYRKKPVVVQAFQMTHARREDNADWPEWLNRAWNFGHEEVGAVYPVALVQDTDDERLMVRTLEGPLTIDWDDWIIQGVQGELYPCKPDIFAATYDAVE